MRNKWFLYGLVAIMAVAVACGGDTKTPASPSVATDLAANAAADGSTLKISAPAPSAPATGSTVADTTPTLVVQNATSTFVPQSIPSYRFIVVDAANATIYDSGLVTAGTSQTQHKIPVDKLKQDVVYRWRARGENGGAFGPWSTYFTFTTPKSLNSIPAYQNATSLWDPLTDGKTIGVQTGMEFTKDFGARTVGNESNIRYDLLQTTSAGEFSFYVYNLNPLSAGDKTKVMSMAEGTGDITTNDYRFTVEKRGVTYPQPGQVRIRVIAGDSSPDAGRIFDSAPTVPPFVKAVWYFVRLTWGAGRVQWQVFNADGTTGVIGSRVANVNMGYGSYTYKPVPHMAYVGAPTGRGGSQDASVANMTVKWLWIGAAGTPRPTFGAALPFPEFDFEGPGF
jgi:hypothetical protein